MSLWAHRIMRMHIGWWTVWKTICVLRYQPIDPYTHTIYSAIYLAKKKSGIKCEESRCRFLRGWIVCAISNCCSLWWCHCCCYVLYCWKESRSPLAFILYSSNGVRVWMAKCFAFSVMAPYIACGWSWSNKKASSTNCQIPTKMVHEQISVGNVQTHTET